MGAGGPSTFQLPWLTHPARLLLGPSRGGVGPHRGEDACFRRHQRVVGDPLNSSFPESAAPGSGVAIEH